MTSKLVVQFKDNLYVIEGPSLAFEEHDNRRQIKDAGFVWDPVTTRFATSHWQTAAALEHYMDETCYQHFNLQRHKSAHLLQLSMNEHLVDETIPKPVGEEYLPFQQSAIKFGTIVDNVLLSDACGLGKTMEAIGVINVMQDKGKRIRVLIISKAAAKINWKRELDKWLVHNFGVHVCAMFDPPSDNDAVQVMNYEILYQHSQYIHDTEWDLLIVDEAHRIKNATTERGALVLGYKNDDGTWQYPPINAKKLIFITATPMPNGRPKELWPLIHRLDPITWPSWKEFALNHCGAYYKKNRKGGQRFIIPPDGATNLPELQLKLRSTIMVRREKEAVLKQLPPKRRQVIELPTDGCEKVILKELKAWNKYQVELSKMKEAVKKAEKSRDNEGYLKAISKLKEGVSAAFSQMSTMRLKTALAKMPMVLAHIDEMVNDGQKFIVFAHHTDVLNAIKAHLGDKAVGGPGAVKQADVDRFQTDQSCIGFLGNIVAAGESITLTAAERVLFVELDWVPGNLTQAEDRAHRIGQLQSVLVQHLVLEGSLDATMAKKIIKKQRRNEQAFNKDKMDSTAVEDLLDILDDAGEHEVLEMEEQRS